MAHNDMTTIHHVDKFNQQQKANQTCQVCQPVCTCQEATYNTQLGMNYFGVGRINDDFEF